MNNVYPVTSTRRRKGAARGRESSVLSPYETCTRFVKTMTSKVAILLYVAIFGVLGQSAFAQTCPTGVTVSAASSSVCTNAGTGTATVTLNIATTPTTAIVGSNVLIYRNGTLIATISNVAAGATSVVYVDNTPTAGTAGYDVTINKTGCTDVTSASPTTVTVNGTPSVASIQANQTICSGATAQFTTTVTGPVAGTVSITYKNVNTNTLFDVSGVTANSSGTTTITVTPTPSPVQTTTYQVMGVTSSNGCTPAAVGTVSTTIFVQSPPAIGNLNTPNPICQGGTLLLYVTPAGPIAGTVTYTWYKNGIALINGATGQGSTISGAGTQTLTITNAQPSDAGNYYVQVCSNDAQYAACGGCAASNVINANVNPLPTATFSTTGTQNVCTNSNNTLTATFTGTGPFSLNYAINGVAQPTLTSNTNTVTIPVNVSTAGATYSYTITSVSDANCVNTVNNPSNVTYVTSTFDIAVSGGLATVCYGSTTSRVITPSGGSNTITYTLTGPTGSTQSIAYPTAATFNNLPAGTYTITAVTNSGAGCTVVRSFTIASFAQTTVSGVTTAPITCNGGNTSVVVTFGPSGANYNLQIASGTYTATASGLAAGTFTFTGVPAGTYTIQSTNTTTNCVVSSQLIVLQPAPVTVTGTPGVTALSCFGGTTTIQASVTGGNSGNYTFVLSGGPTAGTLTSTSSVTFTNVRAGNYTITVTDAKGCTGSVTNVNITEPAQIVGSATATNATCNGGAGSITVNRISGGTGNAVYTISGPSTQTSASTASMSYTFASVAPGTYTVTITDANNCSQQVAVVTVSAPPAITATLSAGTIACGGGSTTLNINNVAGGNGNPITWTLTGTTAGGTFTTVTSTANYFTPVYAGTYTVTAANSGCAQTLVGTVTVTQPAPIVVTTAATTITCNGGTSTVTITATGGTGTKTYQLVNANTAVQFGSTVTNNTGSATFTGVPAGTYNYVVTDNTGCVAQSTPGNASTQVVIAQPAVVTLGAPVVTNATCFGGQNGSIAIRPAGGSGSYTVTLVGTSGTRTLAGTSTVTFTGLTAGTYTITATDVNGCGASGSVVTTVTQPASSGSGAPNLVLSQEASTNTFAPPVSTVNVTYGIANPGANAATGVVLRVTKPTPDYTVTLAAAAAGNDNARWVESANTSGYVEFTLANDPNGNNSITCGSTLPLRVATIITRTAAATGKGDFAVTGIVRSSVPDSFPADNSVVAQFTAQ